MKHMKFKMLIPVSTIFFAGIAGAANLVVGGGFENPAIPAGSPYLLNVTPTGWSGTGDIATQGYAGSVSSGDGNQWLDLNPGFGAGTGISQNLMLSAGTTYQFSFLYNGGGGGSTTQISYSLGSASETLLSGSVSTAAMNVYGGTLWNVFSTAVTPSIGGIETLRFLPNGSYSGGFIDAVNISAVPVPAAVWLFGSGLLGLIGIARRKAVAG